MTLSYETIFSRTRGVIDDPKELLLDPNDLLEIYSERLHGVIGNPRIRRIFSSIICDDETQEIEFSLNNSVDEYADKDFVCKIFSIGMKIEWLQPKVDSVFYTSAMFGTKEEKKLLDEHSNEIKRLDYLKKEMNKMIRDYGYMYNSYINGES